jgi:hypothetical protein
VRLALAHDSVATTDAVAALRAPEGLPFSSRWPLDKIDSD